MKILTLSLATLGLIIGLCVSNAASAADDKKLVEPGASDCELRKAIGGKPCPGDKSEVDADDDSRPGAESRQVMAIPTTSRCNFGQSNQNFAITFETGSAELTPTAKVFAARLAKIIRDSVDNDCRFRIEGHADASGSEEVNGPLSQARAEALRLYFEEVAGLGASRFDVKGYGSERLLDPANPLSPKNRRVELINLAE